MPADQVERAAQGLLAVGDAGRGVADVVEDAVTELENRLAGSGDLHAASEPDEQPLVELVLEQQDLPADGGLGDVEPGTGAGEGAGLGDGADDFELS